MPKSKNIFSIFSIMLSLGIMTYFIFHEHGISELHKVVGNIKYVWLVISFISMIIFVMLESLVLFLFTHKIKKNYKFTQSIKATVMGLYYSAITPMASGGQPAQLYVMMQDGVDGANSGAILGIKFVVFQVTMTIYSGTAIIFFHSYFDKKITGFNIAAAAGLTLNVVVILIVYLVMKKEAITKKMAKLSSIFLTKIKIVKNKELFVTDLYKTIDEFHEGVSTFGKQRKVIAVAVLISFLQFTAYYMVTYFIYVSFNIGHVNIIYIIAAQSILSMIIAFMPTPGGAGVAEAGFGILFSLFFIRSTVIPAMLIWKFITYYSIIIVGGILSFKINGKKEDK